MKKVITTVFLFLIMAIGGFLWSRTLSEEEQIGLVIQQVIDGIEEEKLATVMDVISESYRDEKGLSRDSIKAILLQQFLKKDPIGISITTLMITVNEDTSEVSFDAAIVDGKQEPLFAIPVDSDVIQVAVVLQKQEEDWKIVSHTLQPISRTP